MEIPEYDERGRVLGKHRMELKATLDGETRLRKKFDETRFRVKRRLTEKCVERRKAINCNDPEIGKHIHKLAEEGRISDENTLREIAGLVAKKVEDSDVSAVQIKLMLDVINSDDTSVSKWKDKMCVDVGFVERILRSFSCDIRSDEYCDAHVAFAHLAARLAPSMWVKFFPGVVKWLLPFIENTTTASDKYRLTACKRVSNAIYDILLDGNVIVSEEQMTAFFNVFFLKITQFFSADILSEWLSLVISLMCTIAEIAGRIAIMYNRENVSIAFLTRIIPEIVKMASAIISNQTMHTKLQTPALRAIVACLKLGDNCPAKRLLVLGFGIVPALLRSNFTAAENPSMHNEMYMALELIAKTKQKDIAAELLRSGAIEHCMMFALKTNVDISLREQMLKTVRFYVKCTGTCLPEISKFVLELSRQEFADENRVSEIMCVAMEPLFVEYIRVTSACASENPNFADECITWVVAFLNDSVYYENMTEVKRCVLRGIKHEIGASLFEHQRIRDAFVDDTVDASDTDERDFDFCDDSQDVCCDDF